MRASLGYAIQKIEPLPGITETTIEDVATLLDINLAAKESADRSALSRTQKPTITVRTALAFGLRRISAEIGRRVDAWIILAASAAAVAHVVRVACAGEHPPPTKQHDQREKPGRAA